MYSHTQTQKRRRLGALVAGLVAATGLASGTAATSASAATELAVTVAPEYGLDKVATRLSIVENTAIISKLPQQTTTDADVATLNKTAPKLTCVDSKGTSSASNGTYVNDSGILMMLFIFSAAQSPEKCTLSSSTYVQATGDTVYPLTAAAKAAFFGDPATLVSEANARLKTAIPALKSAWKRTWNYGTLASTLDKALTKYTVNTAVFSFEANSTSTSVMYVLRPDDHKTNWVNLCQRLTDGRAACLRYNGKTAKATYWINYESPNFYTQNMTTETAA